ncbi:putative reverse transcriptase domain-containing protein [Tanacetum coccineum]
MSRGCEYDDPFMRQGKKKILEAQSEASKDFNTPAEMLRGLDIQMERKEDGRLYFVHRIWVLLSGNVIVNEAYAMTYSIHPGADKMCLSCSKVKTEHQKPPGLLQQPEIPEWKWEKIIVDFVMKLPRTSSEHDAIWVIVDRLTKSAHFLASSEDYKLENLETIYIKEVVARHNVPVSIISDRDS